MTESTSTRPSVFDKDKSPILVMPRPPQPIVVAGISLLAMVVGVFLLRSVWRTINPGYIGIIFDKGSNQVKSNVLEPGWTFINPINQDIQKYPIAIQTYSMVQQRVGDRVREDNSVKVQSSDGQKLGLDIVVQYQVQRDALNQLYQDWAGAPIEVIEAEVVGQFTRSQMPLIAAQYSWEEITSTKRSQIANTIAQELRQQFEQRNLQLISFSIPEVHLPENLQKALDDKVQAQQSAEQAQIKAIQAKLEAEGEAAALQVKSKAQAEANEILSRSVTPDLIRYQQIEKWDGKLPMFGGNGVIPMINSTDLLNQNPQTKPTKP